MNLRLHQLRAFIGVVDHGGIRAAARAMHLSQAALTKSLRELEADAGVPLLVRSPRGVAPTAAGDQLLTRARVVARQIDLAGDELKAAAGAVGGQVRAALSPYVVLMHLAPSYSAFRQRHPRVALELMDGLMARALPRLRDGSLDLAVVADTGDLPDTGFATELLAVAEQHAVVRAGHPVLANPTVQALSQLEWLITGPRDGAQAQRLQAAFQAAGVAPPERLVVCDTLAGLTLLRLADVASLMPAPLFAQPEARGLAVVPAALAAPPLRLMLLTRDDAPLAPAALHFVDALRAAIAGAR